MSAAELPGDRGGLLTSESFAILAVASLGAGCTWGIGFQVGGVALLMVAALFCGLALVAPRRGAHPLVWVVALLVSAFAVHNAAHIRWALVLAAAGVLVMLLAPRRLSWLLLPALAIATIHILVGGLWIWGHEGIDVYGLTDGATRALLHGGNPYTPTYPSYVEGVSFTYPVHFPYGPSVVLLAVPGKLAGDVRLMSLLFVIVTVACIALYAWRNRAGAARTVRTTALALAFPLTAVLIVSAWVEAYSVGTLAVWLVLRRRHPRWALVPLALCLATKPTILLVLLPAFVWSRRARVEIILAGIGAAVVVLPFALITGLRQFYDDVAGVHLHLFPDRTDALTINALLHWMGHGFLPAAATVIVGLLLIGLVLWRRPRDGGDYLLLGGLISTVAFLFAKEAFTNYYWSVAMILLLAVAARGSQFDAGSVSTAPVDQRQHAA